MAAISRSGDATVEEDYLHMPTPPRTPASDLIGWSLERDGPLHKGGGF